jgi:hypothetical protein
LEDKKQTPEFERRRIRRLSAAEVVGEPGLRIPGPVLTVRFGPKTKVQFKPGELVRLKAAEYIEYLPVAKTREDLDYLLPFILDESGENALVIEEFLTSGRAGLIFPGTLATVLEQADPFLLVHLLDRDLQPGLQVWALAAYGWAKIGLGGRSVFCLSPTLPLLNN